MRKTFDGKRVSWAWWIILRAARRAGIVFRLNSGRRTLAEQWRLYRAYKAGGTLAAYPLPTAPHIRFGLPNHAIDVDTNVGDGEAGLQRWLQHHGVRVGNPVAGEAWHMDADLRTLVALARRIRRRRARRRRRQS